MGFSMPVKFISFIVLIFILLLKVTALYGAGITYENTKISILDKFSFSSIDKSFFVDFSLLNDNACLVMKNSALGVSEIKLNWNVKSLEAPELPVSKFPIKPNHNVYEVILIPEKNISRNNVQFLQTSSIAKLTSKPSSANFKGSHIAAINWDTVKPKDKPIFFSSVEKLPKNYMLKRFMDTDDLYVDELVFLDKRATPVCFVGKHGVLNLPRCSFIKAVFISKVTRKDSIAKSAIVSAFMSDEAVTNENNMASKEIEELISRPETLKKLVDQLRPDKAKILREIDRPASKNKLLYRNKKTKELKRLLAAYEDIQENPIPEPDLQFKLTGMLKQSFAPKKVATKSKGKQKKAKKAVSEIHALYSSLPAPSGESVPAMHVYRDLQAILFKEFNACLIDEKDISLYGEPATFFHHSSDSVAESVVQAYSKMAYENGISCPEIIIPSTADSGFYRIKDLDSNVKIVVVPVKLDKNATGQLKIEDIKQHITENTVLVVGSVFNEYYGVSDNIAELSQLALSYNRQFGVHVDATLGGFAQLWLNLANINPQAYGFELPGVTSIALNAKNYGNALVDSSMILFRHSLHKHYLTYSVAATGVNYNFIENPDGNFLASHVMAWWSLLSKGSDYYKKELSRLHKIATIMKKDIAEHKELEVVGEPSVCFAMRFKENTVNKGLQERYLKYIKSYIFTKMNLKTRYFDHSIPVLRFCITQEEQESSGFNSNFKLFLSESLADISEGKIFVNSRAVDTVTVVSKFKYPKSKHAFMKAVNEIRRMSSYLKSEEIVEKFKNELRVAIRKETGVLTHIFCEDY